MRRAERVLMWPIHHAGSCNQEPLPIRKEARLTKGKKRKQRRHAVRSRNALPGTWGQCSGEKPRRPVTHLPQPVVVAQLEVQRGGPLPPPTQELLPPPHVLLGQVEVAEL